MMHHTVIRSTAIAVFAAAFGSTSNALQLANPSFEEPGGEGTLWISDRAAGWERWGGWFNRETTWTPVAHGQCIMAYHHWKIVGEETAGIYQDVPNLPANQPYQFSVSAVKDKFTNAEFVELRIEPFMGGEAIASEIYRMNDMKSGKWTTLTVNGSSSTVGIRVLLIVKPGRRANRRGSIKFDSAELAAGQEERIDGVDSPPPKFMYGTIRRHR